MNETLMNQLARIYFDLITASFRRVAFDVLALIIRMLFIINASPATYNRPVCSGVRPR